MVSIQNPSVTVSDVWNYGDRSLTNEPEFFSRLGNSLLNFMLGDTYLNNTWGWFISQGIVENIKYLLNNRVLKVHSWNTTSDTPNEGVTGRIGKYRYTYDGFNNIYKIFKIKPQTFVSDMERIIPDAKSVFVWLDQIETAYPIHIKFLNGGFDAESSTTETYAQTLNDIEIIDNNLIGKIRYTGSDPSTYSFGLSQIASYQSLQQSNPEEQGTAHVARVVDATRYMPNPTTFNLQNITGQSIVNIAIQFLYPTKNNWSMQIYDGDTLKDTITIPVGVTNYTTPVGFEWTGFTNVDALSIRFTTTDTVLYPDSLKGISATEVINTATTLGLIGE